ncbi:MULTISPECIES: hypothetical protein [Bacteroides]|uniref:hypothetical protein n=1 Tax=Bacteroides TaxID=816 RepID=UPI00101DC6D9|nr:hypothetical protein [Bacteroides cellulosilyticus]
MCKDKQTIHYCTILSAGQWDFLLEGKSFAFRQKCLHRLMTGAVRARTVYKIKGIEIVLEVGQVAASDVELAEYLGCNRKTIGKLVDSLNRLGMLTTRTNNRTSIHTLHFLTGWYVGGVLVTNPHYVRPSATTKGETGSVRTPLSDDLPLVGEQTIVPGGSQSGVRNTDSTTALFSSLCSPVISTPSENGQEVCLSETNRTTGDDGTESPKEAQDGTIGGETYPNTGKRI